MMFALHMVHGMYPDMFKENEWEAFTGTIVADVKDAGRQNKELPGWIEPDRASAVLLLKVETNEILYDFYYLDLKMLPNCGASTL